MATNLNSILEALKGGLISKGHSQELVEKAFIGANGGTAEGQAGQPQSVSNLSPIYGGQTPEGMRYENANMGGQPIGQYSQQGPRAGMPYVQTYTAPQQPEQAPNILADADLSELRWSDPNQRDLKISITDAQTYGAPIEHQKALLNKYNKIVMGKYGMFQGPDGSWLQKTREGIKPVIEAKEQGIKAYKPGDYLVSGGQMIGQLPSEEKQPKTEAELTRKALSGDKESKEILEQMQDRRIATAKATGSAVVEARMGIVDIEGTAKAIIAGRETLDNVKNTFGVPVQEGVRSKVLELEPDFNFNLPRTRLAAIKSTLTQQYKVRGMMGSFVKNLNKQLNRVDTIMKDVISRVGVRAADLPIRELRTKFVGSGHEKALEAYLIEISNEIGKLSTGSAASIRELSTDAQERWAKVHDPNLSLKELKIILDETQSMGNMRLESTDEEMEETTRLLDNVRKEERGITKKTGIEDPLGIRK